MNEAIASVHKAGQKCLLYLHLETLCLDVMKTAKLLVLSREMSRAGSRAI